MSEGRIANTAAPHHAIERPLGHNARANSWPHALIAHNSDNSDNADNADTDRYRCPRSL